MDNRTIQNLLDYYILEQLKEFICLDSREIEIYVEKFADNSEDLEEMIDMVMNSKRYNHITTQCGDTYLFGTSYKQVKEFIDWSDGYIRDDDTCWLEYITCNGESYQLNYFIDVNEV